MNLRERIGVDVGSSLSIEKAIEWAKANDIKYIDVNLEDELIDGWSEEKVTSIREAQKDADISFGLHTLSAVNMAEKSPFVNEAVDKYLRAYIDAAETLGADWIIAHGGYHFTSDADERFEIAIKRLQHGFEYAAGSDVTVLLENHNPEPNKAEVHYIPATPEECNRFFNVLPDRDRKWAFNPPHANLHSSGIHGFLDAMDLEHCGEIRLNDNRGTHEEHLMPGEGNIDFKRLFNRIEDAEYDSHYVVAQGDLQSALQSREYLLSLIDD